MRRHPIRPGVAMVAVMALNGCAADHSVAGAEDVLMDNYLEPLGEAGITVTVDNACRYAGDLTAPWHLSVALRNWVSRSPVDGAMRRSSFKHR